MSELIERLKAATRGSFSLDDDIATALNDWETQETFDAHGEAKSLQTHDDYSFSVDAALALVERKLPGAWWIMARGRVRDGEPLHAMQLFRQNHNPFTSVPLAEAEHEDMPFAILIALLTALASGAP